MSRTPCGSWGGWGGWTAANEPVAGSSGCLGNDDFQALEVVAEEARVSGDERRALKQGMCPDQEVRNGARHRAGLVQRTQPLLVTALHLAGADRGASLQRQEPQAHLLDDVHDVGAMAQPGGDFADDD